MTKNDKSKKDDDLLNNPNVFIGRTKGKAHWYILYTNFKFELRYNNDKINFLNVFQLNDDLLKLLINSDSLTTVGYCDKKLRYIYEHGNEMIRKEPNYRLLFNDCQGFATSLSKFMCNKNNISRFNNNIRLTVINDSMMKQSEQIDNAINSMDSQDIFGSNAVKVTLEMINESVQKYDISNKNDRNEFNEFVKKLRHSNINN